MGEAAKPPLQRKELCRSTTPGKPLPAPGFEDHRRDLNRTNATATQTVSRISQNIVILGGQGPGPGGSRGVRRWEAGFDPHTHNRSANHRKAPSNAAVW